MKKKENWLRVLWTTLWIAILLFLVALLDGNSGEFEPHPNQDVYEPGGR